MLKPPLPSRIEKVWAKIAKQPNGCWLWTGAVHRVGYGSLGGELAHRLVYELLVGPIPDEMTIDHLCRVKLCVSPMHLEVVTLAVNVQRAMPYRNHQNGRAERTHCPRNHAYDEANTYINGRGHRCCRACNREAQRERYAALTTGSSPG